MTWAIVIWCVLILAWMVGGVSSTDCEEETSEAARAGCEAGTGLGVALIALVGFFGFVFLALIWFMTRPKTRTCPRCGEDVRKGQMTCPACQFDFATVGTTAPG